MVRETEFVERCRTRGLDGDAVARALSVVEGLEQALFLTGASPMDASIADVEFHVRGLVEAGTCPEDALMAMARYFSVIGNQTAAIRLLAYLLPPSVSWGRFCANSVPFGQSGCYSGTCTGYRLPLLPLSVSGSWNSGVSMPGCTTTTNDRYGPWPGMRRTGRCGSNKK
jgi:hypothetical protein